MAPQNGNPGSARDPKKRKAGSEALSARSDRFQQKRQERHVARSIPAQPAEAGLKDGELDLQAFVAAHEFEIRALEQSMATSKATGTSRAFQKLPRGLRRRTASHNPKRVPKRLRARAMKEMAEDNTPTVESRRRAPRTTRARLRAETAKKLGILAARQKRKRSGEQQASNSGETSTGADKAEGTRRRPKLRTNLLNDPPKPPSKFRKRQLNKTWLPTHAWHAKRARMTEPKNPLWRFALPLTPNEKIYRPVHRMQGDRGAVFWDMSYISTISLSGNTKGLQRVMERVGVFHENCWSDRGQKWRMGSRSWSGQLSRETKSGRRCICPATVIWNPAPKPHTSDEESKEHKRELLLRIHPSAFLETFTELLRLAKMETPQLSVHDLRYEVGSVEITGPASTETLMSILTPRHKRGEPKIKHAELFQGLHGVTNPASLPAQAILGFNVQDPRLRYPPKKAKSPSSEEEREEEEMKMLELLASWPAEDNIQPYDIFDRDQRHKASCLPPQKLLQKRRSSTAPGVALKPVESDPSIPILLISGRPGPNRQAQGTWTLLAPWGCILPFWYSLVHYPLSSGGNPRFAGLNEAKQVAFERGLPFFPSDFLTTNAGVTWELEQRQLRKKAWEKRPKSKRTEWDSLELGAGRKGEVGNGMACDFEYLFSLHRRLGDPDSETSDAMDIDVEDAARSTGELESNPLSQLTPFDKSTFSKLVKSQQLDSAPASSVLTVRLSFLTRGVAKSCARIYRLPRKPILTPPSPNAEVPATDPSPLPSSSSALPSDLRDQWLRLLPQPTDTARSRLGKNGSAKLAKSTDLDTRKRLLAQELTAPPIPWPSAKANVADINGHPFVPDAQDLIGFVTSGSFSLSEGRGIAVGGIAVSKVLDDMREDRTQGALCIVRNAGESVGRIARWEII
ncbi:unnamed protein product [Clonostachys rosea f. rosea IK726]|uniref:Uncharacterized protein n=2 Tax=Bionectria ochroleuca TaxID=29856 RepID=A0A0B7JVI5_BIOOC|nr:unnamed protein product [Clonostachys rosea f. rosea IK726]